MRNAAILILGMGEKCAADILKSLQPSEVKKIMDAIDTIDHVSEEDVLRALNDFFRESKGGTAINSSSKEYLKNSLASALGINYLKNSSLTSALGMNAAKDGSQPKWLELLQNEQINNIVDMIQNEHPQIITALMIILTNINNENASNLAKFLPKELKNHIIKKMTVIGPISTFAFETFASFFEKELSRSDERYNVVPVDGIEAAANIISNLDVETEKEIITDLSNTDKPIVEKIQEKILPFDRLSQLDGKSLQILLGSVQNDDLIMALKGVDEFVRSVFMKNMSQRAAEILLDELESKGPVKLKHVIEAQKRIVATAKKLAQEEKIIISNKNDPDVVY